MYLSDAPCKPDHKYSSSRIHFPPANSKNTVTGMLKKFVEKRQTMKKSGLNRHAKVS